MIVQRTESTLLAFRQTDHARLAGELAERWGSDMLPPPDRRASTLVAAYRHDDGWADWELSPTVDADGRPVDFLRIPVADHVALYRRGIDLVEAEDAFAGLVVSLHGKRLYTRPFQPGGDPRYKRLTPEELPVAEAYVEHEVARERRLVDELSKALGGDAVRVRADADEAWRQLQVWDRLSLFVCLAPLGSGLAFDLPPVRGSHGDDVPLRVCTPAPGRVDVDPYPFSREPEWFEIEAARLDSDRFDGHADFRSAYRRAPRRVLRFSARRAGPDA